MKRFFAGIDILRVVAAAGVCMYHYFFIGVIQGFYAPEVFTAIAFWGEIGVDIFFLISGFLILLSCEKRTCKEFAISRFVRIFPMFLLVSIVTLLMGLIMPNTSASDLVTRCILSWTFFPEIFNSAPLSSIYWTLNVEVRFYILAIILMSTNIWRRQKHRILLVWLIISVLNTFYVQNSWLELFLNTKYAGHFTLGIIVYLILNKHERSALYFFEIPMCFLLIYRNIWSYTTWIRAIYEKLPYSDVELLIATLAVIGLFLTCVNLQAENKHYLNIIRKLSVLTFPYYLIHADLGYFIRTQYYNRLVPTFPGLLSVVNESMLMATGILCSLGLAWLLNQVEKRLLKL